METIKKFLALLTVLVMAFCLVACQDGEDVGTENSSVDNVSSNDDATSKVPVVIVDDEKEDSSNAQSKVDETIDAWENTVPDIDVEVNSSEGSSVSDNTDDSATSSDEETVSSENQSSDNVSSKEDEVSEPNRPDDGYFDVAV